MNTPFVSLCPEITRTNALTLMDWLEDEDVTRFLSDSRHVSRLIEQVIGRVQLPILTHLFNRGGRFFRLRQLRPIDDFRDGTGNMTRVAQIAGDALILQPLHQRQRMCPSNFRAQRNERLVHLHHTLICKE